MSGLVLKLAPKERILINGVVIENGERRTRVSIMTSNANILRLKDAIHPKDATTPVKRVCYIAQLVLSGDTEPTLAKPQLMTGIEHLSQVLVDSDSQQILYQATEAVSQEKFYQALKALRRLLPREDRILKATSK